MSTYRGLPPEDWPKHQDIVWLLTRYRMNLHLNSTLCLQLHKPQGTCKFATPVYRVRVQQTCRASVLLFITYTFID
jgi:hypothetical protein